MHALNLSHGFISLAAWLELEKEHVFQLGKCVCIVYYLIEFLYLAGVIFFLASWIFHLCPCFGVLWISILLWF